MRASISLALFLALLVAVACSAFGDLPSPQACKDIPKGGCPGNGKGDCTDPSCAAVYTCEGDGGWSFAAECPAREAGAPDAHFVARDADIDVPPGASGGPACVDLQAPDCTLTLALLCPANECCGCQDLYVCPDGGWNLWGQCTDGGALVASGAGGAQDK